MTNVIYMSDYRDRRKQQPATIDWASAGIWSIALTFNFSVWGLAFWWLFSR